VETICSFPFPRTSQTIGSSLDWGKAEDEESKEEVRTLEEGFAQEKSEKESRASEIIATFFQDFSWRYRNEKRAESKSLSAPEGKGFFSFSEDSRSKGITRLV
jgi:hypothetical protein